MTDDTTGTAPLPPPETAEKVTQIRKREPKTKADKIAAAAAYAFEDDSPETRAFYARFLILAGMPYSDPGDTSTWTRSAGNRILTLQPGANLDPRVLANLKEGEPPPSGYPYGILPRYVMTWIATEVRKKHSRTLHTGKSLTAFLEKLGLTCTGGPTGTIDRFHSQFWRLLTCRITSTSPVIAGDKFHWDSFNIADDITVWGERVSPGGHLAGAEITLTQKCFEELHEHAVPYNPFALPQFTGSAFQLDLYLWLVYRLFYLREPTLITWKQLQAQFGSNTKETRFFRRHFLRALTPVRHVYKGANITIAKTGIILRPSPRHRSVLP